MRHVGGHPVKRSFTDPVRDIFTILFSCRGREMNNQARLLLHHNSGSIATGDIVGSDPDIEHGIPKRRREFPERSVETALLTSLLGLITGPSIIDEHVKPTLLAVNAVKHGPDLGVITMITAHGNSEASGLCHQRGGLMNRSG